jgi:hypothetical protein
VFRDYYRPFFTQVCKQLLDFGREQIVGLVLAILILFAQLHYGLVRKDVLGSNAMAIIWPYLAVVGAYLVIQIARAPVVIDGERAQEIAVKIHELAVVTAENQELKNPEKLFSLEFKSFFCGLTAGSNLAIIHLKLFNRGPAITLHDIRLCSDDDPTLGLRPQHNGFAERNAANDYIPLQAGDARAGFFQFYIGQCQDQAWVLAFKDTNNKAYREAIPRNLPRA